MEVAYGSYNFHHKKDNLFSIKNTSCPKPFNSWLLFFRDVGLFFSFHIFLGKFSLLHTVSFFFVLIF